MQIKLGAIGETVTGLEDIKQELGLILGTPLGSVPHLPEFGSKLYEYLDKPINIARPLIIAEAYRAIKQNSERFTPTGIKLLEADLAAGKLKFSITGTITDSRTEAEITLEVLAGFAV